MLISKSLTNAVYSSNIFMLRSRCSIFTVFIRLSSSTFLYLLASKFNCFFKVLMMRSLSTGDPTVVKFGTRRRCFCAELICGSKQSYSLSWETCSSSAKVASRHAHLPAPSKSLWRSSFYDCSSYLFCYKYSVRRSRKFFMIVWRSLLRLSINCRVTCFINFSDSRNASSLTSFIICYNFTSIFKVSFKI